MTLERIEAGNDSIKYRLDDSVFDFTQDFIKAKQHATNQPMLLSNLPGTDIFHSQSYSIDCALLYL